MDFGVSLREGRHLEGRILDDGSVVLRHMVRDKVIGELIDISSEAWDHICVQKAAWVNNRFKSAVRAAEERMPLPPPPIRFDPEIPPVTEPRRKVLGECAECGRDVRVGQGGRIGSNDAPLLHSNRIVCAVFQVIDALGEKP